MNQPSLSSTSAGLACSTRRLEAGAGERRDERIVEQVGSDPATAIRAHEAGHFDFADVIVNDGRSLTMLTMPTRAPLAGDRRRRVRAPCDSACSDQACHQKNPDTSHASPRYGELRLGLCAPVTPLFFWRASYMVRFGARERPVAEVALPEATPEPPPRTPPGRHELDRLAGRGIPGRTRASSWQRNFT